MSGRQSRPDDIDVSGTRTTDGSEPTGKDVVGTAQNHLSPDARRLAIYLRKRVEQDGECYLKSRYVAEEIDLSAKQVGAYMHRLQECDVALSIEKWGYTNGTTWRVTG